MRIVIPSRRRSDIIGEQSLRLFPDAYVLVDEAEHGDYRNVVADDRLLTHPGLPNLAYIFNHALDLHGDDSEPLVIVGDDHWDLVAIPGWSARKLKPEHGLTLLDNAWRCATDAGCGLFGFARNTNPTVFEHYRPWRLASWVCSPIGFVPGHGLRFDERLALMQDVDINMQSFMKHRIVWMDTRFCWTGKGLNNKGGNAHLRSHEAYARERAILRQKWGHFIRFDTLPLPGSERYRRGLDGTTNMTYVSVPRTQASY